MNEEMKNCTICGEEIAMDAVKCKHCDCLLEENQNKNEQSSPESIGATPVKNENAFSSLWNPNVAASWSLLFSPIFGALIHAKNWKELGQEENAKKSMLWAYIGMIFMIVFIFLPDSLGFTPAIIFLLVWYFVVGNKQMKYISENQIQYSKKDWKKPISIALISLVAYILFSSLFSSYDESDLEGSWQADINAFIEKAATTAKKKLGRKLTLQERDILEARLQHELGLIEFSFSENILSTNVGGFRVRNEFKVIENGNDTIIIETDQNAKFKIVFQDSDHIEWFTPPSKEGLLLKRID